MIIHQSNLAAFAASIRNTVPATVLTLMLAGGIVLTAAVGDTVYSDQDFDGDGVADHLDHDQDNDGILDRDEGYRSHASLEGYPADSYVLLPEALDTTDDASLDQTAGSVYRYPLLDSRGVPSIDFVGTVVSSNTRVEWAAQQQLPKFKNLGPGQSEIHWRFVRAATDEQLTVNVDLHISDLDGNRAETITINQADIMGYSVSADTHLKIDDTTAGKLSFSATGTTDNTIDDAVTLHLRGVSELHITYSGAPNSNVLPGLDNDAAGFRHGFTAGSLEHYSGVPVLRHTDNDGYPDHRDLDSNNDGIADADPTLDLNDDGMIDGAVDADGIVIPADNEANSASPETPAGAEAEDIGKENSETAADPVMANDAPVQVDTPAPPSLASGTLNRISDLDKDSIADSVEGTGDADGDGVPNQFDLDSDNDGLTDLAEAGAVDRDNNGVVDDPENALVTTFTTVVPDFDNDGLPDFLDTDSDQDSLFDLVEAGGEDQDGDGTIDALVDQNGDGWDDRLMAAPLPVADSDSDGNPDHLDNDNPTTIVLDDFQLANSDIVTGGAAGCVLSDGSQTIDPTLWLLLLVLQLKAPLKRVGFYRRRIIHAF